MGAGKSTAARLLKSYMPVLDLDAVNRHLLDPEQPGWQALHALGWIPFTAAGEIDRKEMANRMFADEERRVQVESILHPMLWKAMEDWTRDKPVCAVEVPLLYETGSESKFDEVWCVTTDEKLALQRLQNGRGYSRQEAMVRLAHQYPAEEKARRSDLCLHNDGTMEELDRQIRERLKSDG